MKGDFSRRTFDRHRHFSRVLMQQGRVLLDADWNAQVAIMLHLLRTVIADFGGRVQAIRDAFLVQPRLDNNNDPRTDDFLIAPGHLYVDGILCENEVEDGVAFSDQEDYPCAESPSFNRPQLAYVDVWERHITYVQDDRIREVALGGPDTTTRARVVWQVKLAELEEPTNCADVPWDELVERWQPKDRGALRARAKEPVGSTLADPCITSPEARYRGPENQLYRVEIHTGGPPGDATFKWSRENGSVALPIRNLAGGVARVETLGAGDRRSLSVGDWVEIEDDHIALGCGAGQLVQVAAIDPVGRSVTLEVPEGWNLPDYDEDTTTHPILRRWDYRQGIEDGGSEADDGALVVDEGVWITLEEGIEIHFDPGPHSYRRGDYWLIPARTATGRVEWPEEEGEPLPRPPDGVDHHYARLAVITKSDTGSLEFEDCLEDDRVTRER